MTKDYSPINDLYGLDPERRPSASSGTSWLVVVVILVCFFSLESIRPARRLRDRPPADFVRASGDLSIQQVREQERVARSYWRLAVEWLQQKYPFGTTLPSSPLDHFTLADESDAGARLRYWNRLREVWNEPESWVKGYEWNTDWVTNLLSSLRTFATNHLSL